MHDESGATHAVVTKEREKPACEPSPPSDGDATEDSVSNDPVPLESERTLRQSLEHLRSEFTGMQAWSEKFAVARRPPNAANLTTSADALDDDPDAQKLMRCGRFLAQTFASGTFRDDVACH